MELSEKAARVVSATVKLRALLKGSSMDHLVFMYVAANPYTTATELHAALDLGETSANTSLGRLKKAGLVADRAGTRDGRYRELFLSEAGRKLALETVVAFD